MPVHNKARNSNGRPHQHQRTLSGGSSKIGLNNLQLTQKDVVQPKQQNLKRAGHSAVELHQARTTSPFPRPVHLTSNPRVQSKERIAAVQQKRAHAPLSNKGKQQQQQQQQQPQRAGFSIAHSDDTDDEEEWVSSESGAATPQNNDDADDDVGGHGTTTPVERQRAGPPASIVSRNNMNGNADRTANGVEDVTTPHAESEMNLTRVETLRPEASSSWAQAQIQPPVVRVQPQSTPATPATTPPPAVKQPPDEPSIRHTRSEAPSPTQLQQKATSRRHPLMRNSSTYGDAKIEMPPHPLIRGQLFHGSSLRPARLAPLTVNSEAAQAQLTASPSSAKTASRAGSPSFMTQSFKESPSEATTAVDRVPSRRGSISSLHSIATLPAPASTRFAGGRAKQDRTRTLSTISTSSSSAALSALNMLPAMSRPGTPPTVVRFPVESRRDAQDGFHQLLPPPYLASHMTVTAKYNPLYDCFERVMRAKHGR